MHQRERRNPDAQPDDAALLASLTPAQRKTLESLKPRGWTLEFARQPLFQEAVAVVCDAEGEQRAILEPSGMLNENLDIPIRQ